MGRDQIDGVGDSFGNETACWRAGRYARQLVAAEAVRAGPTMPARAPTARARRKGRSVLAEVSWRISLRVRRRCRLHHPPPAVGRIVVARPRQLVEIVRIIGVAHALVLTLLSTGLVVRVVALVIQRHDTLHRTSFLGPMLIGNFSSASCLSVTFTLRPPRCMHTRGISRSLA